MKYGLKQITLIKKANIAICSLQANGLTGFQLNNLLQNKSNAFISLTWQGNQGFLVCDVDRVPANTEADCNWLLFEVDYPSSYRLTEVLYGLLEYLAKANLNVSVIAAHNQAYLLVHADDLEAMVCALGRVCHIRWPFDLQGRAA